MRDLDLVLWGASGFTGALVAAVVSTGLLLMIALSAGHSCVQNYGPTCGSIPAAAPDESDRPSQNESSQPPSHKSQLWAKRTLARISRLQDAEYQDA